MAARSGFTGIELSLSHQAGMVVCVALALGSGLDSALGSGLGLGQPLGESQSLAVAPPAQPEPTEKP